MNNLSVAVINLSNEENVGGIIRTASAANLKEVVIVGRKKWKKGSATGAHSKINVIRMRTTEEFLSYCQKQGYSLISIEIGRDSQNIFNYMYPNNPILVIGNEGTGVPESILEKSIARLYIPQYGGVECLNAATSGNIAIYDWVRKNNSCEERSITQRKFDISE